MPGPRSSLATSRGISGPRRARQCASDEPRTGVRARRGAGAAAREREQAGDQVGQDGRAAQQLAAAARRLRIHRVGGVRPQAARPQSVTPELCPLERMRTSSWNAGALRGVPLRTPLTLAVRAWAQKRSPVLDRRLGR